MRPPAATTSTATTGPSTSTAASSFAHRSRLIHDQRAAQEILTIAVLNGSLRFVVIPKFRKPESARIARELVANDLHRICMEPRLR